MKFDEELDRKILGLARIYKLYDYSEHQPHRRKMDKGRKWAQDNIFNNLTILEHSSDEVFARTFREMFKQFDGHIAIRRFPVDNIRVIQIREDFIGGIKYLLNSKDNIYDTISNLVDGEYKVSNLGLPVWSYLAYSKEPDMIIINQRVFAFFNILGIDIGKTALEQSKNIKTYYDHWIKEYNKTAREGQEIDQIDIDHMVWFSQTQEGGQQFMMTNFGAPKGDPLNG